MIHRARFVSLLVCLLLTLIGCQKSEDAATATATASAATDTSSAAPTATPACTAAQSLCANTSSICASAPLTAAAVTPIPGTPCIAESGQEFVDIYSWNAFLALNWPADPSTCESDASKNITAVKSGDGTIAVWQTYMPGENVFVKPPAQPAGWCVGNALAAGAKRIFRNEAKASAAAATLGGAFQSIAEPVNPLQADGNVVTDQSGRWLRYERLMNLIQYNYISDRNGPWNQAALQKMYDSKTPIQLPQGSIEIKAAWKVLTPAEISGGRYFTTTGTVCNTPEGQQTPCDADPVTMGLVGLHIVQNAPNSGAFFWSTFEQVDNDQVFYNQALAGKIEDNTDFAKEPYTELDASCKPINGPTQIRRVTPIQADPQTNAYYQQLLAGSVFANYRLISTQWTTGTAQAGLPPNVANIVLETYVQSNSTQTAQGTATGCLSCHLNATTKIKGQDSNHSFFFLEAQ